MKTVELKTGEVEITSVYLSKNGTQLRFVSYPKRLVYKGREYVLAEA